MASSCSTDNLTDKIIPGEVSSFTSHLSGTCSSKVSVEETRPQPLLTDRITSDNIKFIDPLPISSIGSYPDDIVTIQIETSLVTPGLYAGLSAGLQVVP